MTVTNDSAALNVRSTRTRDPEGGLVTGARSENTSRPCKAHVENMRKEEEEAVSNLPTKGQSFGDTNSVSSEVFADTGSPGRDRSLGLLGCLGGFRLDRSLWLLGSFNIFTIVTTNLCNSNMFRNQHFGDVSWGDPNSQRLVGHE